ncbi:hypothetical protein LEMLEM_LOCUS21499 [Lemmus lemmus]
MNIQATPAAVKKQQPLRCPGAGRLRDFPAGTLRTRLLDFRRGSGPRLSFVESTIAVQGALLSVVQSKAVRLPSVVAGPRWHCHLSRVGSRLSRRGGRGRRGGGGRPHREGRLECAALGCLNWLAARLWRQWRLWRLREGNRTRTPQGGRTRASARPKGSGTRGENCGFKER